MLPSVYAIPVATVPQQCEEINLTGYVVFGASAMGAWLARGEVVFASPPLFLQ